VGYEPKRNLLAEYWVAGFFFLTFLVGDDDLFSAGVVEMHSTTVALIEVVWPELAPVYERKREPVGENRAQLLLQVKGEGGTTGPKGVQISELGIETNALTSKWRGLLEFQSSPDPEAGRNFVHSKPSGAKGSACVLRDPTCQVE